ncbi:MAG: HlyD family efflux transporter periplasmic adaptor subunit [Patescibacteria group bacterium]
MLNRPYFKKIAILVAGFAIASSVFWLYFFYANSFANALEVKRIDISESIPVVGKIIAAEKVDVGFEESGVLLSVEISKGDRVKAGDVLARLDKSSLEIELKHYQAQADLDKIKLAQLLAGTRSEEITLIESKVRELRIKADAAAKSLEDQRLKSDNNLNSLYAQAMDYADTVLLHSDEAMQALGGIYDSNNKFQAIFIVPDSQKKSDAEWAHMLAKTALENVRAGYQNLKNSPSYENTDLILSNFKTNLEVIRSALNKTDEVLSALPVPIGAPSLDTYKTTLAVQRSHINATQSVLLELGQKISSQKIDNQNSINQLEFALKQAHASLEITESELALKKAKPREIELSLYQAQIKESMSRIDFLKKQIQGSSLIAPLDGVVSEIYARKGEMIKSGEQILSIFPLSNAQVEVDLNQSVAEKIKVGDQAEVLFPGDSKISMKGKVTNKDGGKARIALDSDIDITQFGGEAKAVITAVAQKGILAIPRKYVFENDGIEQVYVIDGGKRKPVIVLIGERNNDLVEIKEGLSEGDLVVR